MRGNRAVKFACGSVIMRISSGGYACAAWTARACGENRLVKAHSAQCYRIYIWGFAFSEPNTPISCGETSSAIISTKLGFEFAWANPTRRRNKKSLFSSMDIYIFN